MDHDQRVEALSQAVRVSLAIGGNEPTAVTVKRAKEYFDFLINNVQRTNSDA